MFRILLERYRWRKFRKEQDQAYRKFVSSIEIDSSIPDFTREFTRLGTVYSKHLEGLQDVYCIGWLGRFVPNTGVVDPTILELIEYCKEHNKVDQNFLGYHTCEICNNHQDRGEFIIETESRRYWLPYMVTHYIVDHGYCPPSTFIRDLVNLRASLKT